MFDIKIIIALLCFGQIGAVQVCPPAEDIRPCKCLQQGHFIDAHCAGISTLNELEHAVKRFRGAKFFAFDISNSVFDYLPYDIFENVSIQHLSISKSNMSRIANLGDPQFEGLETSLVSLKITETFTRTHPFAYVFMDHLKALKKMELRKNHVEVLHNEWFRNGLPDLEIIRFVECKIRRVGYRSLQRLKNLKIVDLSDNTINYIPRTALPQPANLLEEIYLERNVLTSLSEDFFTDMPNLKIVNLELNEFITIDETIWGNVWDHLQYVNVDYNPLVCDAKIKWIYEKNENLQKKLIGLCYKPFTLFERELHTLKIEDLK
ncbi:uncharacterized protein NPIL_252861 [Nephila pilipes]|uniref:Uncharacterized protein n=1 Tax=Nephila pilipes TaxID=299642 RepID=A0A8X6UQ62_NEPPI|nr:uncharacterized protein NPIL_252861 [Nephila pilipes]